MELIFFIVAGIMLHFGFYRKIMVITQPILVVAEIMRSFQLLLLYCQRELELHKKMGEDRTRTADLNQPYCMT